MKREEKMAKNGRNTHEVEEIHNQKEKGQGCKSSPYMLTKIFWFFSNFRNEQRR
jgi:hypothetical protein